MNVFLNSGGLQDNEKCISKIVQLGDFVYMSAQLGEGQDIVEQTIVACNKVVDALNEFDLRFDHIVKYTVYLKDLDEKKNFLSVFENFVEKPYPAVSFVGVSDLENGALVAIEGFGVNTLRHEQAHKDSSCGHDCSGCQGGCGNH